MQEGVSVVEMRMVSFRGKAYLVLFICHSCCGFLDHELAVVHAGRILCQAGELGGGQWVWREITS